MSGAPLCPRPEAGSGVPRLALTLAAAGFAAALVLFVVVLAGGPLRAIWAPGDEAVLGLAINGADALLLVLVTAVTGIVLAYARRHMLADRAAGRFAGLALATSAATSLLIASGTLVTLALAWSAAGLGACLMVGLHRDRPLARDAMRRMALSFTLADIALWAAVIAATIRWGGVDLTALPADAGAATFIAVGFVIAAVGRCALMPLHGWLPASIVAPTPVSALLHAGIVNGGGILLLKTGGLTGASELAVALAFAAGAVTVVVATASMLARPDVKGSLACSTSAQMGFMVAVWAAGLPVAALLHLVAHALYKASLFLGSGAPMHRRRLVHSLAERASALPRPARIAAAAVVPGVALAAVAGLAGAQSEAYVLLVLAWATAGTALYAWLSRTTSAGSALRASAAVAVGAAAYAGIVVAGEELLHPVVTEVGASAQTAALIAVGLLLLLAAARRLRPSLPPALTDALYVRALCAGASLPTSPGSLALRPPGAVAMAARTVSTSGGRA